MRFISLFFLLPALAQANWLTVSPTKFPLAAPPSRGSAVEIQDFEILHQYQESRTESDCQEARRQRYPTVEAFFGPATGLLTEVEYSRNKIFLGKVSTVAERVSHHWKEQYERPRPYDTDPTLSPCVQKPGGSKSYPSSHTMIANTVGCVLAEIYPNYAKEFRQAGKRAGQLRAITGVHHPSDVAASEKLAQNICDYLLSDSEFMEEVAEHR
jgi:hypothetical protein